MNNPLHITYPNSYLATVCVRIRQHSTVAKTMIAADDPDQAMSMLTHIYGVGNVLSIVAHNTPSPSIHGERPSTLN